MYSITSRVAALREEAVTTKHYMQFYAAQRNVYNLLGTSDAMAKGLTNTEIVAAGITRVLDSFTPVILPGEVIVGFNFGEAQYPEHYEPADSPEGVGNASKKRYFGGGWCPLFRPESHPHPKPQSPCHTGAFGNRTPIGF